MALAAGAASRPPRLIAASAHSPTALVDVRARHSGSDDARSSCSATSGSSASATGRTLRAASIELTPRFAAPGPSRDTGVAAGRRRLRPQVYDSGVHTEGSGRRLWAATRGSRLALWQTDFVAARLAQAWPGLTVEAVHIETRGDRMPDVPLATGLAALAERTLLADLEGGCRCRSPRWRGPAQTAGSGAAALRERGGEAILARVRVASDTLPPPAAL